MIAIYVMSVISIFTLGHAIDTGAIDKDGIHTDKAKIEHVYNLNK